jgi:hypothetical protein
MNYETLTGDLSAMCRDALLSDEPLSLQEIPHFETIYETEHVHSDEEYALWLAKYLYD